MTRILERQNFRVFGYTDPAQALAVFRIQPNEFDVVVTDLSMPHLTQTRPIPVSPDTNVGGESPLWSQPASPDTKH